MEEERDFVVFTDDDGNEFELDVIEYFDYNGDEYAVLIDTNEQCDCENEEECDCEQGLYIMKIVVNEADDTEEFVPPADEDMPELIKLVESLFEDGGCCCGEEDCDCGCSDKE